MSKGKSKGQSKSQAKGPSKSKSKNGKPPIPVLRVSGRDLEIYQLTAIENKTQREVAILHKISQPRVSGILKRVRKWLGDTSPHGLDELSREERLNMVARTHRMKLKWMYGQAIDAWKESCKPQTTLKDKFIKGRNSWSGR